MDYNGYNAIYMPNHHRAFKNGMVYEHIIVAEKILNRKLKNEEVVHHIDKNRKNNNENNLMIFSTVADHTAYHNGAKAIQNDDKTWVCIDKSNYKKNKCPICGNDKWSTSKYCIKCVNLYHKKRNVIWPTMEELKELIFTMPFTKIGELFGVSDNSVRKWCKYYNLPYRKNDIKLLKTK